MWCVGCSLSELSRERDDARKSEYSERKPNAELLEHERKRNIELKCVELQDEMEEQG
jgi:serine/arginine repetitive matrix protein 2